MYGHEGPGSSDLAQPASLAKHADVHVGLMISALHHEHHQGFQTSKADLLVCKRMKAVNVPEQKATSQLHAGMG